MLTLQSPTALFTGDTGIDTSANTLFERLGGEETLRTAVQAFYFNVFRDERVAHLFADVNSERLLRHQQDFMAYAFGGPGSYTGRSLREAHGKLVAERGLDDQHFDAIVEVLATTLQDLEVDTELIAEVCRIVNGVRKEVLGR